MSDDFVGALDGLRPESVQRHLHIGLSAAEPHFTHQHFFAAQCVFAIGNPHFVQLIAGFGSLQPKCPAAVFPNLCFHGLSCP